VKKDQKQRGKREKAHLDSWKFLEIFGILKNERGNRETEGGDGQERSTSAMFFESK
jgi:hypothetical protein